VIFAYGLGEPGAGVADVATSAQAFRIAFLLMGASMAVCFGFFIAMEEVPLRGAVKAAEVELV